ncbi:MAG: response regulator [Pedobacter sp.]|nr:MAG: response regulator [Pedobacter sp.]
MISTVPNRQRSNRNRAFPLLVIEDNKDHQLLIGYSLRAKIPLAQPVFASSVTEALTHLKITFDKQEDFPQLVLLDLYLPDPSLGWKLLKDIRTRYPRLPVIILSSHQDEAVVETAYELGAHSFINKPMDLDEWEHYFRVLNDYWLGTVTLPSKS